MLNWIRRCASIHLLSRRFTDYSSTFISKGQPVKLDKTQITAFYKSVHPDLMANAPQEYREQNSKSMQDLNAYIQAIEQNNGASYIKLDFYADPEKIKKKGKDLEQQFKKFSVELLPIKPNTSDDLRKMHIKQYI